MPADDRARVEHAVAADLDEIAQHRAELLDAGLNVLPAVVHDDQPLIRLDIRGDRARAHVGLEAQNAVAHVVVMGRLDVVEQDDVLQLDRVADHAVRADERRAPDERAVAHLGLGADDAGRAQIGRRHDLGGLVHPDLGRDLVVFRRVKLCAQLENAVLDARERLPRIGELREVLPRQRMRQIIEIRDFVHL